MTFVRYIPVASLVAVLLGLPACTFDSETNPHGQDSAIEKASNMQRCMAEKGWEGKVEPDGGLTHSYPDAQKDQFQAAFKECSDKLGYNVPPPPMTLDEAEAYYQELLEAGECVRGLGYQTPDLPSKQQSIDSLMSTKRDPLWDPYEYVVAQNSRSERDRVFAKCPQPGGPKPK